jgi:hypothetical protein
MNDMKTTIRLARAASLFKDNIAKKLNVRVEDLPDRPVEETVSATEEVIDDVFDRETLLHWSAEICHSALQSSIAQANIEAITNDERVISSEEILENPAHLMEALVENIPLFVYHGYLAGLLETKTNNVEKIRPADFVRVFKKVADSNPELDKVDNMINNLSEMLTPEAASFIKESASSSLCDTTGELLMLLTGLSLGHSLTKEMELVRHSEGNA